MSEFEYKAHLLKMKAEMYDAFRKFQSELETVGKSKRAYNYDYAPIEVCFPYLLPLLNKHGFCLLQPLCYSTDASQTVLRTILGYKNGLEIKGEIVLEVKDPLNAQKVGSYITYMRRYSALGMTGLTAEDEDDDGEKTVSRQYPPAAQPQGHNQGHQPPRPNTASQARSQGDLIDDYVIGFGKFKGKRLKDVGPGELSGYCTWLKGQKKMSQFTKEFVEIAEKYVSSLNMAPRVDGAPKIESHDFADPPPDDDIPF